MNQITVGGHLGSDPEVRFTSTGKKVTTLRVAARVRKGAKDKDETIWWRVSIWGEDFDKMLTYFKKGSPIILVGEMNKPEIFTDREGKPQISMSMTAFNVMFSPFGRPDQPASTEVAPSVSSPEPAAYGQSMATAPSFSDDEMPF